METAVRKAEVLLEALGWIRRFRGRYVVIKLGGSALEETDAVRQVLTDVLFMETVGMKPIQIHGGGKAISQAMNAAGIEPRFIHGRRYT
ncbi:MAG: acetylglutamate kinase, partial [Planctomycetaceae bacterium]